MSSAVDGIAPDEAGAARAVPGVTVEPVGPDDLAVLREQLGRPARGVVGVAARCPQGHPAVVVTEPRLPDGTPFPTTFYITCPRLASAIGTLEASGLMREMSARLERDADLAARHRAAHEHYLRARAALGDVPEIAGVSAGGMPVRVKCLHVLVGHALAAGPGVNPCGDEAVALLGTWCPPAPADLPAPTPAPGADA